MERFEEEELIEAEKRAGEKAKRQVASRDLPKMEVIKKFGRQLRPIYIYAPVLRLECWMRFFLGLAMRTDI